MAQDNGGTPESIGNYQILQELSDSANATVYLAQEARLKVPVALKVLKLPEPALRREVLDRFLREARTMAGLEHTNIIRFYHAVIQPDRPRATDRNYIVMEHCPESLSDLLGRAENKRLSVEQAVDIMRQVCRGLIYLHRQDPPIWHQDVKPDNLLLTSDGTVKIIDFGIARQVRQDTQTINLGNRSVAVPRGTAQYVSPEQALGRSVDQRTDVFALGNLLCKLLTGHTPLELYPDARGVIEFHRDMKRMPYEELMREADVPLPIRDVVGKALEIRPGLRYQSVAELLDDLEARIGTQLPQRDQEPTGFLRRFRRMVPYTATSFFSGLALMALAAYTTVPLWDGPPGCDSVRVQGFAVAGTAYPPGHTVALERPAGPPTTQEVEVELLLDRQPDECIGEPNLNWSMILTLPDGPERQQSQFEHLEHITLVYPSQADSVRVLVAGSLPGANSDRDFSDSITLTLAR